MKNTDKFIETFRKVRDMGFVKSHRTNNTGIGKTLEDFMGVVENNQRDPDLFGYEIKSQRNLSTSFVTLFTKSPTSPEGANAIIKDEYGYIEEGKDSNQKKIHASIFATKVTNSEKSGHGFRLYVDKERRRIYLHVFDLNGHLIDDRIYYSFDVIEQSLMKINNLAYVSADIKHMPDGEYFNFRRATLFSNFRGLDFFLEEIIKGNIMYDIRIGSYKSGRNIGKAHDHGSGFRIGKNMIRNLYKDFNEI